MEALIHHFKMVTEGVSVPPGEVYVPVESPARRARRSTSSPTAGTAPYRVKIRDPSFANLQAVPQMVRGGFVADVVAVDRERRPGDGRGRPVIGRCSPTSGATGPRARRTRRDGTPRAASVRRVLPLLYLVQSVEGRLTQEGLREVGELLGITTAEVEAVASFYTMLRLRPTGTHVVSVCTNLSCALRGANEVFEAAHEACRGRARRGELARRRCSPFTRRSASGPATRRRCVQIDFANHDRVTPERIVELVAGAPRRRGPRAVARPRPEGLPRRLPDPRRRRGDRVSAVADDEDRDRQLGRPEAVGIDGYLATGGYEGLRDGPRDDARPT